MTRVMVIDNQADLARAFKVGLKSSDIEADAYTDPLQAIKDFQPDKYDLVLLDIHMPAIDGFDVYRELKRIDSDVPICFLTAFDFKEAEFKRLFPDANVDRVLRKPITMSNLLEEVRRLVAPRHR